MRYILGRRDGLRALALLPMLMLAGCGLTRSDFTAMDPGDTLAADSKEGVLVYGVTVDGIAPAEEYRAKTVWLVEKNPQDPLDFADRREIPLPDDIRPGERRLVVWRVPAGLWSFRQFRWTEDGRKGATPPLAGHALATAVAPGAVIYAGDFTLDAGRQPAQIRLADRSADARRILAAEYPDLAARMRDQLPEDLRKSSRSHGKDSEKGRTR